MNNYKEAKAWIDRINAHPEWARCDFEEPALSQLTELVEKAAPKKPIHSYDVEPDGAHRDFYNCPNCHSELGDEIYNYCQWCGQKIDGKDLEDDLENMEWL